jgi:hypothetical protein
VTDLLELVLKTEGPIIAVLDERMRILRASLSFLRLTAADAQGRSLREFVDAESCRHHTLDEQTRRIPLRDREGGLQTLECTVLRSDEGLVIIGARSFLVHSDLITAKSQLENKLTSLNRELQRKVHELQQAREEIQTLASLLPICAYCKKIRNDDGYWESLERFFSERTHLSFSHGICEECLTKHFPDDEDDG